MSKQYLKALKTINFSDTGITLSAGRVFFLEDSKVYAYSKAVSKVITFSDMADWVVKLESSNTVQKTDSFEYNSFVSSLSKEVKKVAKPSSTTYQDVTTSVKADMRFQPVSGHQAFIRPLANAAFPTPKATSGAVSFPTVEVPHIRTATVETPTGKHEMDLSNGGAVKSETSSVENRFSVVDVPQGKEATPMDLENLYRQNNQSPDGMYNMVEAIEVAVTEKAKVSEFDAQWETYINLPKKADKVEFIDGLSYPGVIQFFIDKTRQLIQEAEEGTYKLSKPMQKMHKNLLSTLESKLKVGRMDV